MNLGQAVAVCLYEIIRSPQGAKAAITPKRSAAATDLDRLTDLLQDVLQESGYVHAGAGSSTSMKLRRLVRRLNLDAHDAEVWLGMLRQIRWKLNQSRSMG